ncbi:MAG: hypothetical protein US75_C0012G0007 [Candidatus Woesebacteria bacterium GW2011_GWC1_38_13]|uniref:Uncharacterized protein n=2 Tax=Candidatus Woeseibacteriota TaxID=1752722 RepID=A0A0G0P3P8_9BACT|nr:MAG: hypothetical protein US75_C0012G0007 [Candidatus Woesebacteria bacterium GW2011_GWC1_38_13]KKQ83921.1 MAG: hypothetical protein UT06_C0013G0021 [Candidatus Woesebacteria bacterium GW2011_GWA1_38_8]
MALNSFHHQNLIRCFHEIIVEYQQMEKCQFSGVFKCSDSKGCVLMENEGVPEGDLGKITETFADLSSEELVHYIKVHNTGGRYAEKCLSSPIIVRILNSMLVQRGEKPVI